MNEKGWSKPYYGITHCLSAPKWMRLTITTITENKCYEAYVINMNIAAFTPIAEQIFTSLKAAKAWLEKYIP